MTKQAVRRNDKAVIPVKTGIQARSRMMGDGLCSDELRGDELLSDELRSDEMRKKPNPPSSPHLLVAAQLVTHNRHYISSLVIISSNLASRPRRSRSPNQARR